MPTTIKVRRGTEAQWAQSLNPVLSAGEPGYDTTNKMLKIGDGSTTWALLPFLVDSKRFAQKAGEGVNFVVVDASAGTTAGNGVNLLAAYANAKILTPNGAALSATNRGVLFIPPGVYELTAPLAIDAEFVDIYGLGQTAQKQAVVITGDTFTITAADVRVSGIEATVAGSFVGTPAFATVENCNGPDGHIGDVLVYAAGMAYKIVLSGDPLVVGIAPAQASPEDDGFVLVPADGSNSIPDGSHTFYRSNDASEPDATGTILGAVVDNSNFLTPLPFPATVAWPGTSTDGDYKTSLFGSQTFAKYTGV